MNEQREEGPDCIDREPETAKTARTAILVIHGIGQQKSFETLDQFARTFLTTYRSMALELLNYVS